MTDTTDRLVSVLAPALEAVGLGCYDVELVGPNRSRTLRVLVDREGGVDLDAITAATQALAPVLDADPAVARALPGAYLLEVSSPGVERPLRTPAHFRAAIGAPVSLKHRTADGTVVRERVVVTDADADGIDVDVDGEHRRIALGDVLSARTVFEWGPAPKPGKARGAASPRPGQRKPAVASAVSEEAR